MTDLRNSLADLAERVKDATAMSAAAARTSVEKAAEAGFLLCLAKEECRHGEWLPFLDRAAIPERQAQRLMRIARAGLNPSSLSDLGGVKGALDYIAELALPEPGDILFVSAEGEDVGDAATLRCAWIEPDRERPGFFHLVGIDRGTAKETVNPISADIVKGDGAFVCAVWHCLEQIISIAPADREFTTMPAEMLSKDTFDFLGALDEPIDLSQGMPHAHQMPASYEHARATLTACVESFSLDKAKEAWRAVSALEAKMHSWPSGPQMMPIYGRIAKGEIDLLVKAVCLLTKANHPELFERGAA